jgi:hypothetical protein
MRTTLFGLAALGVLTACSSSTGGPNDASTDAPSEAQQDAGPVTCTTPGAACPGGGSCFFPVGECTATTGVCADDSACAGAATESVCQCDGTTKTAVPQCGPGGSALAKAASFGPCPADAGTD